MKIALGSDHAGFALKERIKTWVRELGHDPVDFGAHGPESSDYPDFVGPAAEAVARGACERGIVFGGSGNGEAISANKVPGIRCGLCWNLETARLNRLHNDGNVLSLGARVVSEADALEIVRTWLTTGYEGGRHAPRVAKVAGLESRYGSHLPPG